MQSNNKVTIRKKPLGPLVVEGEVTIIDANGKEFPLNKISLCGCGKSSKMLFCDGTHKEALQNNKTL